MRRLFLERRKYLVAVAILLALAAGVLWWLRPQDQRSQRVVALRPSSEGLTSKDPKIRVEAIRLAMNGDKAKLDRVVPFLKDDSAEVRRAAVLAIGLAEETVTVQDMLPLLQDPDPEVRGLCEKALRGRGLQETHIKLAKLISDQRPVQRLQVVHHLNDAEDLDPGIWLLHLSQDPSPAVRAAAIRFAAEVATTDFQQRMLQMAREDSNPTVRQLTAFYLKRGN